MHHNVYVSCVIGVLVGIAASTLATWRLRHELRCLRHQATHDALTQLPNRAAATAIARSKRVGGVLFADVDGLKRINDEHGHATGDELIKAVATRLARTTRRGETAIRLGGDEFVVFLRPGAAVAERARDYLTAVTGPADLGAGVSVVVSASMGAARLHPGVPVPVAVARADAAMYAAKRAGTGVQVYDPDVHGVIDHVEARPARRARDNRQTSQLTGTSHQGG